MLGMVHAPITQPSWDGHQPMACLTYICQMPSHILADGEERLLHGEEPQLAGM